MLAAGDTFRAAAAEQLQGWAQRSSSQLVARADDRQKPDSLLRVALDRVRSLAQMLQFECGRTRGNLLNCNLLPFNM